MSSQFDLRLVLYTPLGARIGPIPDLGFTIADTPAGPTLNATVSTAIYGTLPQFMEVAVEWWHVSTKTWSEHRDSRFAVTQVTSDDRDKSGTATLTGLGLGAFLLAAAQLNGVTPYMDTTGTTEATRTNAAVSVSGTTFTWASHVLAAGDRVRITAKGNAKNINTGSVYYVKNPTSSTFQLARGNATSAAIDAGTASNVGMSRVVTRVVFTDTHQFSKNDSVAVTGGAALGLTDGSRYYIVNPTAATVQLTDKPGGVPIELNAASTNISQVYRYLDGQRVFSNATPGTVMDAVFLEARGRGWGVNPTDSSQQMLHGWTTGAGSDGVAWTKMADDPDTPGISIGFQPGTPGTQVLQALLDNQYAEWYTSGRTIHLVNYGTGNDHSADASPMRIGTTASAVKVESDITNLRNAIVVRGTGPILVEQDGTLAAGSWGRLEVYETAQGATSKTLATKQAKTDLAANSVPSVGYTVTEVAQEAAWLPMVHYSRGDWVACQLQTSGWAKLRCVGWTFTKASNGAITVTTNLEKIKRHLLTKQQKAIVTASAGLGSTSTPGAPLQESDNRPPAAPLGVTVSSVGYFSTDSKALATATVSWLPVTQDANGGDVQAVEYEVWVRPEGAQNGSAVGRTAGLLLDVPNLASGTFYEVSVRAKSSTGQWGELCPEVEVQAAYSVVVLTAPTAPTVTGSLGSVRVAWDGLLTDPVSGTTSPPSGFAYVYVGFSTTSGGTYSPIGTNMGHQGYAVAGGLTVGSTYWFGLFAVNSIGVVSAMSAPTSFTVVGISGPDLLANSVTANQMAAGSITADKLDLGTVPQGNPTDRVPMPLTSSAFWTLALTGTTTKVVFGNATGATVVPTGVTLSGSFPSIWLTQKNPDPASSYIYLSGLTTAGLATFFVREWTAANVTSDTAVPITPNGQQYQLKSTTVSYAVWAQLPAASGTDTIEAAHVTEALGAGYNYEGATIQPDGLRIYSGENANPILALTSSSDDVLSLSSAAGDQVAAIDTAGNAGFTTVNAGAGSTFDGAPLLLDPSDPGFADTLSESAPNGNGWTRGDVTLADGSAGQVALLDRLGRGPIYDVTWPTQNGLSFSTQYRRIAQDSFILEDGRSYLIAVQTAGLQINNTYGVNCYLEFQVGLVPNTSPTSGDTINRAVVYNGNAGYWVLPHIIWGASANQATIDHVDRIFPAGVPIYWQLNFNMSSAPSAAVALAEFGGSRGLTVIDVGSVYPTRPGNGADTLADVHDYSTSGASSGSTSGGTTATSKTVTGTASWSRSWNGSGGSIVSGTSQYTNAKALYQGNGASAMGSEFGFSSTFLAQFAGKSISSAYVYLKNAYQAYSGKSALLSTTADTAAPATISGRGSNQFSKGFSAGQGQWVALSSAIRSGLSAGTVKAFRLGVDGTNSEYMYFEGVGYGSHPPQLKVTFH